MRRAAKVDATHESIVSALRAAGATVQSLAAVGKGCPDLLISFRGQMFLIEAKTGRRKLNAAQVKWIFDWGSDVHVVREPDEALRVIGALV